jgi:hypothetical protein
VDASEERDKEYKRTVNNVQDMTSLVTKTPWMRYTKWAERFACQDMKLLHDLTNLPKADDVDGTIISDVLSEVMRDCWDGYHDCLERGWQLLPFWLA